jgi:hypothetical protein
VTRMNTAVSHRTVRHAGPAMSPVLDETTRTAIAIADDCARSDIEMFCPLERVDGLDWFDLHRIGDDFNGSVKRMVQRSLRYLRLRGQKLIEHESRPGLVRFPD